MKLLGFIDLAVCLDSGLQDSFSKEFPGSLKNVLGLFWNYICSLGKFFLVIKSFQNVFFLRFPLPLKLIVNDDHDDGFLMTHNISLARLCPPKCFPVSFLLLQEFFVVSELSVWLIRNQHIYLSLVCGTINVKLHGELLSYGKEKNSTGFIYELSNYGIGQL